MHRFWLQLLLGGLLAFLATLPSQAADNPHGDPSLDCQQCHSAEAWIPLRSPLGFSHDDTGWPLSGSHFVLACAACHESPVFAHVGVLCADCHRDAHLGELGLRCETCHDTRSWSNQREAFDAHSRTLFPLLASHASLECGACHESSRPFEYSALPLDCYACHDEDFRGADDPDHVAGGFDTDCTACHGGVPTSWNDASFFHPASFPLLGGHGGLPCESCHGDTLTALPSECVSCHLADYQSTRDPDHVRSGLGTQCQVCHSIDGWRPAAFDHAQTAFPLEGAHRSLECAECHVDGAPSPQPDCYSCHAADYRATRDPDHERSAYPTTCETCHSQNAWRPATAIDHDLTRFPLTGAHRGVDCGACHTQGYAGTPTVCSACHQQEYEATRDPDHRAAGFPNQCETCHSTSAWVPADWDHDRLFPIDSGEHRGAWNACSDCHTNPATYSFFDCTTCHEHSRSEMDGEHDEVAGYVYESQSCYSCHPDGRE